MSTGLTRHYIIGVPVAATTRTELSNLVVEWALDNRNVHAVAAADVHVITRTRHESDFQAALGKFDYIYPDGMPLVWCLNKQLPANRKLQERVSGPEIMSDCLQLSQTNDKLVHICIGGSEKLLADLKAAVDQNYPNAKVARYYSPPFGEWPGDEIPKMLQMIRDTGANLIWIGLGCPKQEKWIGENFERLPNGVYFSVGAAFAFHAGHVARAPAFLQRMGLEWLYRIYCEPKRLWKRYFLYNSLFLYYLLRDAIWGAPKLAVFSKACCVSSST